MRYKRFFLSAVVMVSLLNVGVSGICSKAPITAKIVFTSSRDGNREIYIMNPDGSDQVRLTHHTDLVASWRCASL